MDAKKDFDPITEGELFDDSEAFAQIREFTLGGIRRAVEKQLGMEECPLDPELFDPVIQGALSRVRTIVSTAMLRRFNAQMDEREAGLEAEAEAIVLRQLAMVSFPPSGGTMH